MNRVKEHLTLLCTLLVLSGATAPAYAQEETSSYSGDLWTRSTATGDWRGIRTRLADRGITIKPRLTQFYQGLNASAGDDGDAYGGKADLLLQADLGKLRFWDGLSLNIQAEYNFGQSLNGRGGTLLPVNTALLFPGLNGADAFDLSSVYLGQKFGDSASLIFGKINMIEDLSGHPFSGGAGIDAFQNIAFAAPPTGTVPPYLFGALLSVRTEPATFGLWVYDPNSIVNRSGLEDPFADGVTFRATVEFPVAIAGLSGHQQFGVTYSTKSGTDLKGLGETDIPIPPRGTVGIKDLRYHFGYRFDQYLYQSKENPREGFGLFGQFGISDGNPNRIDWEMMVGVGGTGLIPGRSHDKWGVGFYRYSVSNFVKEAFPFLTIRDEEGWEFFYNAALTPWFNLTADLQIIEPGLATDTALFFGLRPVIRF